MLRLTQILLLVGLLASCSIIDDNDITDPNVRPKFSSASISGAGQEGFTDLGSATFQSDAQNRPTSINWSGLTLTGEFRFRSGSLLATTSLQGTAFLTEPTASNVTTSLSYDGSGNVAEITNASGSSIFEKYTFEYDNQNHVTKMVTIYGDPSSPCILNGTDCGGTAIMLRDSLVYTSGKLEYIKRQIYSGNPSSQLAIYIGYGRQPGSFNFSGTTSDIGAFAIKEFSNMAGIPDPEAEIFTTNQFNTSNRYSYFQNEPGNWYGGKLDFTDPSGMFPFIGNIDIQLATRGEVLARISIADIRFFPDGSFQNDQSNRSDYRNRLPDYYYFHPFWLFPNLFNNGIQLSQLYYSDWWIVTQETDLSFDFLQDRDYEVNYSLIP